MPVDSTSNKLEYQARPDAMPSLASYLAVLFSSTLPVLPTASRARGHFTPSALGFPTALTMIPRSMFKTQTPRSWEVARCVQYLVWAWAVVTCLQAVTRTYQRVKRGSLKLDPKAEGTSTPSKSTAGGINSPAPAPAPSASTPSSSSSRYTPSPFFTTLLLHLISWRLATTLIQPNLPGAWNWPYDATTLIGLGTGLACSWSEVWTILQITGLVGGEPHPSHQRSKLSRS